MGYLIFLLGMCKYQKFFLKVKDRKIVFFITLNEFRTSILNYLGFFLLLQKKKD